MPDEKRVLLAEDDADLRLLLTRALRRRGWEVEALSDGADALESVRIHPPDVVLLDGNLPGMSGAAVCAALKSDVRTAQVPVVMLTGHQRDVVATDARGADEHLTKPVDVATLDSTLTRLISR